MKNRDSLLRGFFLLFFASFFLPFKAVDVFAMGLLVIIALTHSTVKEKINLFKERKYIWFMLAFAGMLVISYFLSDNRENGMRTLQLRIPLLLFPISVGLLGLTKQQRNRMLLDLAFIVTLAGIVCVAVAFYRYRQQHNPDWMYNDALTDIIGQQSIYTSVFVNISIFVFTYYILYHPLPAGKKLLLAVAILFLLGFSYLLASRNMMLILYSTILIFVFYVALKRKKYLEALTLLLGIMIAGFLVLKFFPKTVNRFRELAFTKFDYENLAKESHYADTLTADKWNGANFRLAAWPCGWQLFKENPVVGTGIGDKKDELFEEYRKRNFHFAINTRKNVHNNYLDILLSTGIIGFSFFLLGWLILPFTRIIKERDALGFMILILFSIAMFTENYFDRSLGAMLFGFMVPFLLAGSGRRNKAGQ